MLKLVMKVWQIYVMNSEHSWRSALWSSRAFVVLSFCVFHYYKKVLLIIPYVMVICEAQHVIMLSPRQTTGLVLVPVLPLIKFP